MKNIDSKGPLLYNVSNKKIIHPTQGWSRGAGNKSTFKEIGFNDLKGKD
jgi:hypothetical protein